MTTRAARTRFSRRWLAAQAALLAVLLAVFAFSAFQVRAYEDGVRRDSFTLPGAIPASVLRFTPDRSALNVVAVLAHGYSANKEIMSSFAVDLARQGITTYTYDFPGHGSSPVPYGGTAGLSPTRQLVASLGEVVDYAQAHAPARDTRVVLVGYSLGTIAVGEYALQHPEKASLAATVLVAGILGAHPTLTTPRNMLVLSGQFDLPGINDTARNLTADGCGVALRAVTDTYQCGAPPQNERRRVVLTGLDHISIVTAGSTHAAVLSWLGATVDPRIGHVPVNTDARLHWMLLAFLAAALATLPLLALGSAALRLAPAGAGIAPAAPAQTKSGEAPAEVLLPGWGALLAYGGALAGALGLLKLYLPTDFWAAEPFPFGFLRQQVSGDTAVLFLLAGGLLLGTLALVPALRRSVAWPRWRGWGRQVALAVAMPLFLYATLGALSSFAWESLALPPDRLWRAGVYALLVLPFFLGMRAILVALARRWPRRGALAELGFAVLILVAFGAAIAMNFGRLSYLGILLPVVAIALFANIGIAAWIRRVVARPTLALALGQSLLLGWLLAATLPIVTYR